MIQASVKVPFAQKGYFKYNEQVVLGVSFAFPTPFYKKKK